MQLQLASFWKRISAWLFDFILLGVFAILFAFALSGTLGYTTHSNAMEAAYNKYETQYGITFDITDNSASIEVRAGNLLPEDADAPMMAVISRLASHKGVDIIAGMLRHVLETHPKAQFVVLGTGEAQFESYFRQLEQDFPERVRAFITYNRALSKKIYAAADIFLMPSKSEPCGLSQMIACRYGTVPVVRETGGLYDSIKPYFEDCNGPHGNGFTFANYEASELEERTCAALELYEREPEKFAALRYRALTSDFSWDASAEKYMEMYQDM